MQKKTNLTKLANTTPPKIETKEANVTKFRRVVPEINRP